jgi:SAM-dependent methyltransferase
MASDATIRSSTTGIGELRAFVRVLADALLDSGERSERELAREFEREDPWTYDTPRGRRRFARELALLDAAGVGGTIPAALEIGCAEGHFTELLADRCRSLLAVDVNRVALERARRRASGRSNVEFLRWDLRSEPVLGQFDLVVATSVLEYFKSPQALRHARAKLVASLRPGGLLLIGNVGMSPSIEKAKWGRVLPRGAANVNAFVSRHPCLEVVKEAYGEGYVDMLLVKQDRR